jgi:hypothetical protein
MSCRHFVLLALLAACSKVKRSGDAPAGSAHDGGVTIAEHTEDVPLEAPARQLLRYVPADSEIALVVDFAQLRRTPFYDVIMRTRLPILEPVRSAEQCGFTATRDLDRMVIAGHSLATGRGLLVLQGQFDEGPLMACIRKQQPAIRDEPVHGHTIHHVNEGRDITVLFQSRHTVLIGPEEWTTRIASGLPAAGPPALDRLAGTIDTGKPVWFAGVVDPAKPQDFDSMTGTFTVAADIAVHVLVHFKTAAEAARAANQAARVKQMASSMVSAIDVKADAEVASFDIRLNEAQAEQILPMLKATP